MKIAVVGAGALGCLFGGRLAAADHEVWLLHHREEVARVLSNEGVTVRRPGEAPLTVAVDATTDASDVGPADLVLVLVRAHQTGTALADHAACIGPDTRVLSVQNGLRTDDHLRDAVGRDRAYCGVTYEAATAAGPGTVTHTAAGLTTFGGGTARGRSAIRDALTDAGFDVESVADPRPVVWEKGVLVLATAPVLTLTGCPVGRLTTDPLAGVVTQLLTEAAHVAASQGVDVDVAERRETVASMARSHGDHTVSMAQDVAQGRRTEIDELNGVVLDLAEDADVDVPANALVTALVHGLERCS
ncbi:ketopantoate reductase family protein [Haloarchaeobius sp. HRN-SO-5]|uniref:ketopantoate reductase family protein n=1 Tax=Haloarchaeobius sp. HRN-SO-5 TaxID=3446118 RepID=UPI003EB77226